MKKVKEALGFLVHNKYPNYVLLMLMLTYLLNQLNTFCLIATNVSMAQDIKYGERDCAPLNASLANDIVSANETLADYCKQKDNSCEEPESGSNATLCYWKYPGRGMEFQLLAGPLYIVLFSISGIPMGLISELNNINRKVFLVVCALLWSAMTIIGGFSTQYWHLAVTRTLMGIFSAGCVPFCASIISDYFAQDVRGGALGFYNWGVYVGYSLTYLLLIAERSLGWRAVYFIAGAPALVLGIVILFTVKEPARGATEANAEKALDQLAGTWKKLKTAAACFLEPSLLLLCLGGAIRNGAGIAWAYNNVAFYSIYHPGTKVENWMSWVPLVFGSLGSISGGIISDRLSGKHGTVGRLMVLIGCTVISAPFMVGTLYAPSELSSFLCYIPGVILGEMWIGVCVAVVLDLVPADLRTSAVAVYFFIIQIIGGNTPLLIPPLNEVVTLREALAICFPGLYIVGALFFVLCLLVVLRQRKKHAGYAPGNTKDANPTEMAAPTDDKEEEASLKA